MTKKRETIFDLLSMKDKRQNRSKSSVATHKRQCNRCESFKKEISLKDREITLRDEEIRKLIGKLEMIHQASATSQEQNISDMSSSPISFHDVETPDRSPGRSQQLRAGKVTIQEIIDWVIESGPKTYSSNKKDNGYNLEALYLKLLDSKLESLKSDDVSKSLKICADNIPPERRDVPTHEGAENSKVTALNCST